MDDAMDYDNHPCETPNCDYIVGYDDEPFCFTHSPDSGSSLPGYSYKAMHEVAE